MFPRLAPPAAARTWLPACALLAAAVCTLAPAESRAQAQPPARSIAQPQPDPRASPSAPSAAVDPALAHARRLLAGTILVDGHNDLPIAIRGYKPAPGDLAAYDLRKPTPGATDIPRLRAGYVGAQFWSVYIPSDGPGPFARMQLEQIDLARRMIERYPDVFGLATTAAEIRAVRRSGRIASLLGIEGGAAIDDSLGALRAYYDLGVRYMTLTHNSHSHWADAAAEPAPLHHGLTPFGEEVVREMNRLGMMVDLSHTSVDTMAAALRVSAAPVIFSHAATRAVCDVPRNVPDDVLLALRRNGGIVMVTFVAGFVDCEVARVMQPALNQFNARVKLAKTPEERAHAIAEFKAIVVPPTSVAKVADQVEHARVVVGVDGIGLGGDFDGNEWWPVGLSDVSMYPNLFAELIRRGWSDADLRKLAGENLLRVMEQVERTAARLQKERPASLVQFR
jgi:membrane dipeptidase